MHAGTVRAPATLGRAPAGSAPPQHYAMKRLLLRGLASAAAACCPAASLAAQSPAQSPWNGAWTLDAARSSPDAKEGAADGYVFHIGRDGRIRWEIPSLGEVVTGRVDGQPMPIRRPGAPAGLTLAVRPDGPRGLRYTVAHNGTPVGEGRMTLVEDGRAWADITWQAGRPEHAQLVVYVRK